MYVRDVSAITSRTKKRVDWNTKLNSKFKCKLQIELTLDTHSGSVGANNNKSLQCITVLAADRRQSLEGFAVRRSLFANHLRQH